MRNLESFESSFWFKNSIKFKKQASLFKKTCSFWIEISNISPMNSQYFFFI